MIVTVPQRQKCQRVICMKVRKRFWRILVCIRWDWFHPPRYRWILAKVHFILRDFLKASFSKKLESPPRKVELAVLRGSQAFGNGPR